MYIYIFMIIYVYIYISFHQNMRLPKESGHLPNMWKSAHPKAPIFSPCNPLHHRVVLNTLADTCQNLYQSLHDPRVFYPNSSIIQTSLKGVSSWDIALHRLIWSTLQEKRTPPVEVRPPIAPAQGFFWPSVRFDGVHRAFLLQLGFGIAFAALPTFSSVGPLGVRWAFLGPSSRSCDSLDIHV